MSDNQEFNHLSKQEVVEIIKEMVAIYDNLPQEALFAPITHQDHHTLLLLLLAFLGGDEIVSTPK